MSVRKRSEALKASNGTIHHTEKVSNGTIHAVDKIVDAKTDHTRWRLKDDRGRQTWHYLSSDEELKQWPMTTADKYYLGLDTVSEHVHLIVSVAH